MPRGCGVRGKNGRNAEGVSYINSILPKSEEVDDPFHKQHCPSCPEVLGGQHCLSCREVLKVSAARTFRTDCQDGPGSAAPTSRAIQEGRGRDPV